LPEGIKPLAYPPIGIFPLPFFLFFRIASLISRFPDTRIALSVLTEGDFYCQQQQFGLLFLRSLYIYCPAYVSWRDLRFCQRLHTQCPAKVVLSRHSAGRVAARRSASAQSTRRSGNGRRTATTAAFTACRRLPRRTRSLRSSRSRACLRCMFLPCCSLLPVSLPRSSPYPSNRT
jgi:hypothetical protein